MPRSTRRLAAVPVALLLATGGLVALAASPAGAVVTAGVTGGNTLMVTSNAADDLTITCVTGNVSVDNGGGNVLLTPTACSAITAIFVQGQGTFDNVFDLSAVTTANGFTGDPTVTMDGGPGNDTLTGSSFVDTMSGGSGDDRLIGGPGNDVMNGGDGDDTLVWNNGDGSDTMSGENGTGDTVEVNGSNTAGDTFTADQKTGDATHVTFQRTNLGTFTLDIATTEKLDVNGQGGDDTFTAGPLGLAVTGVALDVDGGDGNDTITGGDGADVLSGGAGNDTITGFKGNDTVSGGDGNDVLIWNNGDGSDAMDGGAGSDTVQVNGSAAAADTFTLQPGTTPGSMRFDRTNLGPFGLDITTAELLDLRDAGTVGPDTFTITGSAGADVATVSPDETSGLGIATRHTGIEQLTIDTSTGDDRVTAQAGAIPYTIDGGAGTDVLTVDGGGSVVSVSTIEVTGRQPITNLNFEHVGFVNTAPRGYWVLGDNGSVTPFGTATSFGNAAGSPLTLPVVGGATTPSRQGYWLVARDGGIFSYGDAGFYGSTGAITLNQPIVGMASTPTGLGYWLVGRRRRRVRLRRRRVLRLHRGDHAQPADRRDGVHPHRQGLLAGRHRRRHLQLRRRHLLRLHRRHRPEPADRRDGVDADGPGLLVRGRRRRHLQLRRRHLLRLHGRHRAEPADRRMAAHADRRSGYWFVAERRRRLQLRRRHLPRLGRRHAQPGQGGRPHRRGPVAAGTTALAVVGTRREGQPLHHELTARDGDSHLTAGRRPGDEPSELGGRRRGRGASVELEDVEELVDEVGGGVGVEAHREVAGTLGGHHAPAQQRGRLDAHHEVGLLGRAARPGDATVARPDGELLRRVPRVDAPRAAQGAVGRAATRRRGGPPGRPSRPARRRRGRGGRGGAGPSAPGRARPRRGRDRRR